MANPVSKSLTKDIWTLVAENVLAGAIDLKDDHIRYVVTFVMNGEAVPISKSLALDVPRDGIEIVTYNSEPIDVYMMSIGEDGEVIASLP